LFMIVISYSTPSTIQMLIHCPSGLVYSTITQDTDGDRDKYSYMDQCGGLNTKSNLVT